MGDGPQGLLRLRPADLLRHRGRRRPSLLSRVPLPPAAIQTQTTFLYDANGKQLAALDSGQNRVLVSLHQVPQVAIDAILSTEDHDYYKHGAVDPLGIIRATISDIRGHGNLQGASTITQQYVKTVYLGSKRTFSRKLTEAFLAIKLQRQLSKDQILERYLNTSYFGRGAYGIQAASQAYFGEDVSKLGLPEASFLAGLIRSPETDDPYRGYAPTAVARRLLTLKAMVRDHKITEAQLQEVERVPITTTVRGLPAPPPLGTVTDSEHGTQYFVDYVRAQLIRHYGQDRVLSGGLRVTTTLDSTMQDQAWEAIYGGATGLQPYQANPEPAGASVAIDDKGQVKALVGGKDYNQSQVDLALGADGGGTGRQPGSTFKPFLLAETLKEGYTVQSKFPGTAEDRRSKAGEPAARTTRSTTSTTRTPGRTSAWSTPPPIPSTPSTPSSRWRSAHTAPRRHGHPARDQPDRGGAERAAGARHRPRCRSSRWPPPTTPSPTAASTSRPGSSPRSRPPTARCCRGAIRPPARS